MTKSNDEVDEVQDEVVWLSYDEVFWRGWWSRLTKLKDEIKGQISTTVKPSFRISK